jgi:branched-chain amino acid transport system substrate-binding protein
LSQRIRRTPSASSAPSTRFGYSNVPFGYAAGQIVAKAVEETKSLDHNTLAQYIHTHTFTTVAGDIAFGKDGEWAEPRVLYTQFQNVAPNDLEQFRTVEREPILWSDKHKTGSIVYPFAEARK